jgi:xanthine dehydrogenase YagR molybdenum-binding subunit
MFPHGPAGESLVPLQQDTIYYSGQHLGIVIADTLERATYAATLIDVTYEEQTPTATLKDALERREEPQALPAPLVKQFNASRGDLPQGLAEALVRIDETYSTSVNHHNPMETSATTAVWTTTN